MVSKTRYFFDILPKNIVLLDDEVWSLVAAPFFTADKKIIVITSQDIEEDTEIQILKNILNYAFFREENNLILTNALIKKEAFLQKKRYVITENLLRLQKQQRFFLN